MNFKDKVIVITGAAGGIGHVCVKSYLDMGATVIMLDIASKRFDELLDEYKNQNVEGFEMHSDDVSSIKNVVQTIKEKYHHVDSLIQIAGWMDSQDALDIDEVTWDKMNNINIKGTFFMAQQIVKYCMQGNGTIVNFSSAAAICGFTGNMASAHYSSSKGAIISLTKQLAVEWGPKNIRVNAVVPGGVMTEAMKKMGFPETIYETIPLRKLSTPQNIIDVVMFLTSDLSAMITGQSIIIDGGASIMG